MKLRVVEALSADQGCLTPGQRHFFAKPSSPAGFTVPRTRVLSEGFLVGEWPSKAASAYDLLAVCSRRE